MLKFHAETYIRISNLLAKISHTFEIWKAEGKWRSRTLNVPPMHCDICSLHNDLTKLGLFMAAKSAMRLIDIIKADKINPDHFNVMAQDLNQRIIDELQQCTFLMIPFDKINHYNPNGPIWGKEIQDKFPELIEDITEANNCFALERYTACVFHLMRVMEKAVQKYANKLGISESFTCDEEWQKIINAIRGQLNTLYPKQKSPDRIEYESILGHLETVKIAWRNPTMHPKATYTEEEAKAILSAVEIFIKDLVKIL